MVIDFTTLYDFPRQMERFMDTWNPLFISQRKTSYPPLNISEDEHNIYVRAELPGLNIEDVELVLTDSTLSIKGERKPVSGKYFRQERPTGVFQRILNVNIPVDREGVKASMKDGILKVVLPKSPEVKPRKIEIQAS